LLDILTLIVILVLTLVIVSVSFLFLYLKNKEWFKKYFRRLFAVGTAVIVSTTSIIILYNPPGADSGWHNPSHTSMFYESWTNPSNICTSNNFYTFAVSEKDPLYQDCYDFDFSIPAGSIIDGIEVSVEGRVDGDPSDLSVELSWDSGVSQTSSGYYVTLEDSEGEHVAGSSSDKWGRSWVVGDFSAANFDVIIGTVTAEIIFI
jgi:hypothetical protein